MSFNETFPDGDGLAESRLAKAGTKARKFGAAAWRALRAPTVRRRESQQEATARELFDRVYGLSQGLNRTALSVATAHHEKCALGGVETVDAVTGILRARSWRVALNDGDHLTVVSEVGDMGAIGAPATGIELDGMNYFVTPDGQPLRITAGDGDGDILCIPLGDEEVSGLEEVLHHALQGLRTEQKNAA